MIVKLRTAGGEFQRLILRMRDLNMTTLPVEIGAPLQVRTHGARFRMGGGGTFGLMHTGMLCAGGAAECDAGAADCKLDCARARGSVARYAFGG